MNARIVILVLGVVLIGGLSYSRLFPRASNELQTPGCPANTLVAQAKSADLIVQGSIFMVTPSTLGTDVVVVPERVYKGDWQRASLNIAAIAVTPSSGANSGDDSEELHFSSQEPGPYIFFLRQRDDGRYNTRRCYGTRLLGPGLSAAEQDILGAGTLHD